MGKIKDLVGCKYGKLTVMELSHVKGNAYWKCSCECGNTKVVNSNELRKGDTKSCGCYNSKKSSERLTTHGFSKEKLYKVYCSMKERCENKNNKSYKNYGEKGIRVCKQWKSDYVLFRDWAIENGYKPGLTIERINNYKNYDPDNCKFVTRYEQAQNKRNTLYVGTTNLTLKKYCELNKISYSAVHSRMMKKKYYSDLVPHIIKTKSESEQ